MQLSVFFALALTFASNVEADIYMHNPRGSNNRNCRNDNNENRRNGNRLFDSQNNDKGGYSCPNAMPFACYKLQDANDGNLNQGGCQNQVANVDKNGVLTYNGDYQKYFVGNTESMAYYSGSVLELDWTEQHGSGENERLMSNIVIQYAEESSLQDNCGANPIATAADAQACKSPFVAHADVNGGAACGLRDGTPTRLNGGNQQRDQEATATIGDNTNDQDDGRYGRHETFNYYQECKNRQRNKGLWIADQNLQGDGAIYTRQNNNGNRNGLECPEESEYYPYWHASPWKDAAVIVSNSEMCGLYTTQSQNVVSKGRCSCAPGQCDGDGQQPNNPAACAAKGATWCTDPAHGLAAPVCMVGPESRQNHLGNAVGGIQASNYNFTFPTVTTPTKFVVRIRYNITTLDVGGLPAVADAGQNGGVIPDNDENEAGGYKAVNGFNAELSLAINSNQVGRTFQDRSYTFEVKPRPAGLAASANIKNLNVRGKRGNIVQAYPAVEYDFVPPNLVAGANDFIHVQWTGSDYNPNRNGNNGEGGPYAANNNNQETKSDRYNIVLSTLAAENSPMTTTATMGLFAPTQWTKGYKWSPNTAADEKTLYNRLAFLDQDIFNLQKNQNPGNEQSCAAFDTLDNDNQLNNRAEREETYQNCAKLSGAATPHFDAGLVQLKAAPGEYKYMSTRNNNFSNRGHKGVITVSTLAAVPTTNSDAYGVLKTDDFGLAINTDASPPKSAGTGVGIGLGLVAVAAVGAAVVFKRRRDAATSNNIMPQQQQQMQNHNGQW